MSAAPPRARAPERGGRRRARASRFAPLARAAALTTWALLAVAASAAAAGAASPLEPWPSRIVPAAQQRGTGDAPAAPAAQRPDTLQAGARGPAATGVGDARDTLPAGPSAPSLVTPPRETDTPLHLRALSLLGTFLLIGLAWLLSVDRGAIRWRIVVWGLALQLVFALLVLETEPGRVFFAAVNDAFVKLLGFTQEGARFVFGNLVDQNVPVGTPAGEPASGAPIPGGSVTGWARTGAYFAFTVLPTIIFFSSLMSLLYYLGFLQIVVRFFAWIMRRTMRTSGAETLAASANIFVGQTEAPLMVKPFVASMTLSELMCLMTAGFANTAGGVMAAYVGLLSPYFPDIAGHLLAATIMSAPAAIAFSKIIVPEREQPVTSGEAPVEVPSPDVNVIDATTRGASEGLALALNVGAMLLAFIALIALLNAGVGWAGGWFGAEGLTLQTILGWVLAPLALAMGVAPADAVEVGSLLGVKTVVNEFVAYLQLTEELGGGTSLSPRSVVIATYALSGFANFSSIAIQIGGIGGLAPERRADLSRLGLRAMVAGSLASFQTATIAGMLI